ncbi:transcriptional regulator, LuxR family [Chthoniobacter flavus Ellin428]|uniref:Transcriptional regulator, LuxR family n=1 Tax=Chthoniobacter flavus Ellin428 TaxID=497964 RepID=B4D8L5_9BACT|nr:LuxR C-terminal-related transcriptional regulator [Chthoniobacter flavus]EDY17237.1 transcriptional regulator, LuxR family [Chthoniobacter flavus Ellin428]
MVLSISVRTVEKHVETVYRKLGVENRMGAVLRVLSSKARD